MFSFYGVTTGTVFTTQRGSTSEIFNRSARVSVQSTLDGGSTMVHEGFNAADSSIRPVFEGLTNAENASLLAIMETDTLVYLSCAAGFFSGAISEISIKGDKTNITFAVKEQIQ